MKILKTVGFLLFVALSPLFIFAQANQAPVLTATGNQFYCPTLPQSIVTDFNIYDPDDTGIDFIYIQISAGYVFGQDILTLTGNHPTILSTWDAANGKMTLTGNGTQSTYTALIAAVKAITFLNNTSSPSGNRKFSITIDQANYLPSNGHYYKFIPNIGITWKDAKIAAQASTYYGLQGYLATITSSDEAQLAGTQSAGAGWIGGSDEATEGSWQWMTGPETNQNIGYTNWNTGEPNQAGDEDYAHITAAGVGILGSWNDLSNTGSASGNYQPKGFIVEYGGMPGDPLIQISAFTTIIMPEIINFVAAKNCGSGSVTLEANANTGQINWYDAATGGNLLSSSATFQTPVLSTTTTFFAVAHQMGCADINRVGVKATIIDIPILMVSSTSSKCENIASSIIASTTVGVISWFDSTTATTPIFAGTIFDIPNVTQNTTYYVQADNNGCFSAKVAIQVNFFSSPQAQNEVIKLCPDEKVFLNAKNPNMTYLWNTGAITESIETDGMLTTYSVLITNANNCSVTKNFALQYQIVPKIEGVFVDGSTATIKTYNTGDFEFSVDGITYQDSNIFYFSEGGDFTAYVRDKTQCMIDKMKFSVIKFQEFFSPNNDSYNDLWQIRGMAQNPKFEVSVFDRFGRLIVFLNAKKIDWDGTLNGKAVPADDYWYVCTLDNNQVLKGHFSLKR